MDIRQVLANDVGGRVDEMIDIRREVHARPELAFQETATTALVRDRLTELGLSLRSCPTPTGAVAMLEGGP